MNTYEVEMENGDTYEVDVEDKTEGVSSNKQPNPSILKGLLDVGKAVSKPLPDYAFGEGSTAKNLSNLPGIQASMNASPMYGVLSSTGFKIPNQLAGQEAASQLSLLGLLQLAGIGSMTTKQAIGQTVESGNIASRIVNSLIRPQHKQYLFGKNPGLGIAKEGIVAGNMDGLLNKVDNKLSEIGSAISEVRSTPENLNKTIKLEDTLQPLRNVLGELKKAPRRHQAEIQTIYDTLSDLLGHNLDNLTIGEAYNIKGIVSKMQKWASEGEAGKAVNGAVRQVYHLIDEKIDKSIPELKQLNERMANMISASQAIQHRMEVIQRSDPMPTAMKLLDLPFAWAKTTGAKTTLGKLLSTRYRLPK